MIIIMPLNGSRALCIVIVVVAVALCHSRPPLPLPLSCCSSAAGITRSQERSCCAQLGLEVTKASLAPVCVFRFNVSIKLN